MTAEPSCPPPSFRPRSRLAAAVTHILVAGAALGIAVWIENESFLVEAHPWRLLRATSVLAWRAVCAVSLWRIVDTWLLPWISLRAVVFGERGWAEVEPRTRAAVAGVWAAAPHLWVLAFVLASPI